MAEEFHAPGVDGRSGEHARRSAICGDVEHHISVEALHLMRAACTLVKGILQFARRLEPCPAGYQVVGPLVISDLPDIRLKTQLVIAPCLADAHVVARPFDDERLHRQNPLATAKRRRRVVDDLPLWGLRTNALPEQETRRERERYEEVPSHGSHLSGPMMKPNAHSVKDGP